MSRHQHRAAQAATEQATTVAERPPVAITLPPAPAVEAPRAEAGPAVPIDEAHVMHIKIRVDIYDAYCRHANRTGESVNSIAREILSRYAPGLVPRA